MKIEEAETLMQLHQARNGIDWAEWDEILRMVLEATRLEADVVRAEYECRLALQKASWKREIVLDVEAERERCARVLDALHEQCGGSHTYYAFAARELRESASLSNNIEDL